MDLPIVIREKLLEDLYQSVLEPKPWRTFFETLRDWLGASKVFIVTASDAGQFEMPFQLGWDDAFPLRYAEDWSHRDILLHACLAKLRATGGDWAGCRESLMDESIFVNSHIYRSSFRPEGEFCFAAAVLGSGEMGFEALLGLRWPASTNEVKEHVIDLLAALAPHIRHALNLTKRLIDLRGRAMGTHLAGELYGLPFLLISKHGRVKYVSTEAQKILDGTPQMAIRDSYLVADTFMQNAKLQSFIQGIFGSSESDMRDHRMALQSLRGEARSKRNVAKGRLSNNMMLLEGANVHSSVRLLICPVPTSDVSDPESSALMFLLDPRASPLSRAQLLRDCYRLTPKECTLIDVLVEGRTVKEIGQLLNLTEATVRFHLRQVFRKTGKRSQSDLIKLVLTLPCLEGAYAGESRGKLVASESKDLVETQRHIREPRQVKRIDDSSDTVSLEVTSQLLKAI